MWNFLSNRKHLNVSWRVVELPVETYLGRSNLEVSTPRLSMLRSFLIKSFEFFRVLLLCLNCNVLWLEIKPWQKKKKKSVDCISPPCHFEIQPALCCCYSISSWKQWKCVKTKQINERTLFPPDNLLYQDVPFFFLSFLLHWVSEGHQLCHVVYMLTQKEGQVLAIRSLGLMWPGHGHGSSESPVEPEWHVVSIHLQSETFYANWQSVALAYPPPRGNSPDWCLLDMH